MTVSAAETDETVESDPGAHYDLDRPIRLRALTYLFEGDEATVGCPATDSYGILPADGAALVQRLEAGMTPNEAAVWYAQTYSQDVDVVDLLDALTELEFIAEPDEVLAEAGPVRWQRFGRVLFGPIGWVAFIALLVAAIVSMVELPAARPSYHSIFFSRWLTLITGVSILGQIAGGLLHESFHALAGRRLGLRSSLGISRRLFYVVFETNLDGLVTIPRRRRYLPILAGMVADAMVISVLTVLGTVTHSGTGGLRVVSGVAFGLAVTTLLRLIWQLYFFLQTDLYFLATTVLGCTDLHETAKTVLRNRFWRLLGRDDRIRDEAALGQRDLAVARWYSWLIVLGYAFSLVTLVLFMVPSLWVLITRIRHGFADHATWGTLTDLSVFLVLSLAPLMAFVVVAVRDRRRRRAAIRLAAAIN